MKSHITNLSAALFVYFLVLGELGSPEFLAAPGARSYDRHPRGHVLCLAHGDPNQPKNLKTLNGSSRN